MAPYHPSPLHSSPAHEVRAHLPAESATLRSPSDTGACTRPYRLATPSVLPLVLLPLREVSLWIHARAPAAPPIFNNADCPGLPGIVAPSLRDNMKCHDQGMHFHSVDAISVNLITHRQYFYFQLCCLIAILINDNKKISFTALFFI